MVELITRQYNSFVLFVESRAFSLSLFPPSLPLFLRSLNEFVNLHVNVTSKAVQFILCFFLRKSQIFMFLTWHERIMFARSTRAPNAQ